MSFKRVGGVWVGSIVNNYDCSSRGETTTVCLASTLTACVSGVLDFIEVNKRG